MEILCLMFLINELKVMNGGRAGKSLVAYEDFFLQKKIPASVTQTH